LLTYKVKPLSKESTHIIERIRFFIESLGLIVKDNLVQPCLYIGKDENEIIKNQLEQFKISHQIVAINISAGAGIRYWHAEKWIQLMNLIKEKNLNIKFVLLSTKQDIRIVKQINSVMLDDCIVQRNFNFQHYAAYIKNSDFLISPDTSAIHIASAFKIPIIGLYPKSKWNFSSWKPFKTKYRAIMSNEENINSISPQEVCNAFFDLFNTVCITRERKK
jgi:ADP-heptose:LPS heptosyltransferase